MCVPMQCGADGHRHGALRVGRLLGLLQLLLLLALAAGSGQGRGGGRGRDGVGVGHGGEVVRHNVVPHDDAALLVAGHQQTWSG